MVSLLLSSPFSPFLLFSSLSSLLLSSLHFLPLSLYPLRRCAPRRARWAGEATAATEAAAAAEKEEELVPWWIVPLALTAIPLAYFGGLVLGAITAVSFLGLTCYLAYRVSVVTRRGGGEEEEEEEGARGEGGGGETLDERDDAKSKTQVAQVNTSHNDTFAWVMVAIALGLTAAGAGAAYEGKYWTFAFPFTQLPIPLAAMLAWAVTLPRGCSPWPVFVIVMVIMPYGTHIGFLMDPLSWGTSYHEYIKGLGLDHGTEGTMQQRIGSFLFLSSVLYATTCLPFYLGLHAARDLWVSTTRNRERESEARRVLLLHEKPTLY